MFFILSNSPFRAGVAVFRFYARAYMDWKNKTSAARRFFCGVGPPCSRILNDALEEKFMTASTGARGIGITWAAVALSLILAADTRSYAQNQPSSALPELGKLRILYAGRPGSDREKDFVGFLKKYFDVVQTGNLETFKEADTQGFDVTLLDWDWNDLQGPRPTVSESFSRPVITIGVPGGLIGRQWRLKTGYL
jgi:hypothetical protein